MSARELVRTIRQEVRTSTLPRKAQPLLSLIAGLHAFRLGGDMNSLHSKIAVFLTSDDAAFVTGKRVMASGGWR